MHDIKNPRAGHGIAGGQPSARQYAARHRNDQGRGPHHPYRELLLRQPDAFWRWNWRSRKRAERADALNDVPRIRAELNDLRGNVERMGHLVLATARSLRQRR